MPSYKEITNRACFEYNGQMITNAILIGYKYDFISPDLFYIQDSIKDKLNITCTATSCPKQSKIYLASNIPVDINTIRKSYVIKRKPEDADYIVVAKLKQTHTRWMSGCFFYPDKKLIVPFNHIDKSEITEIKEKYDVQSEGIKIGDIMFHCFKDSKHLIEDLIHGNFTKPTVLYSNLDLASGDDITYDMLELTRRLGLKTESESVNNYILNLKALNNYNWREFKGTLSMLFQVLYRGATDCAHREICRRLKSQCKTVYDIITNCRCFTGYISDKDMKLGQEYIMKELNIQNLPMFVTPTQIIDKLYAANIPLLCFEKAFSAITKITIKEYVKQEKED